MTAELSLAGTGFLLVAAPGGGSGAPLEALRLGVSRPSEETLVLERRAGAPGELPVSLASIDLPGASVEAARAGVELEVRRDGSRAASLPPGAPPFELEPGDTLLVEGALLALRYVPWDPERSPGFRAWLRADAAGAARVRDDFARFCESAEVPDAVVHDLALALQEALDNVVEHAYRGRPRGVALVEADLEGGSRVVVTVRDRGPAFDPATVPSPRPFAPVADGKPGGFGLHLVRNLVDTLRYERKSGENRLVFGRRLAGT